jgi:hypothetical protein
VFLLEDESNKSFEEAFKFQLGINEMLKRNKFSNIKGNIASIYILFILDLLKIKNKNNYYFLLIIL